VLLCEKSESLGGALKHSDGVSFKADLVRFKDHLVGRLESVGVNVALNVEVTPELVEIGRPDVLIISVGAEPIVPEIPGVDKPTVLLAAGIHSAEAKIGARVVVVGGGLVGCETGLHLAQLGYDVTIVEMLDEVAEDANLMHRRGLLLELQKAVKVKTGLKCVEILGQGLVAVDKRGKNQTLQCDTVVIAVGYRPRTAVVDALVGTVPEVMTIGDCVRPRKLLQAVRMGYDAGMAI
jgi:pyruvate/2-oxoglutarate dehydrogenase complex dihydrolipoamide dehydrogenase (E3) component